MYVYCLPVVMVYKCCCSNGVGEVGWWGGGVGVW